MLSLFGLLFFAHAFCSIGHIIKEACTPIIPAENWGNKELYYNDLFNGVSAEQRMKNAVNGRYKLDKQHKEPHRDPVDGKIIIENETLYREDVRNYGAYQARKWVEQGKYNLTPEEFAKEKERIQNKYNRLCGM